MYNQLAIVKEEQWNSAAPKIPNQEVYVAWSAHISRRQGREKESTAFAKEWVQKAVEISLREEEWREKGDSQHRDRGRGLFVSCPADSAHFCPLFAV